jgi:hypothetical protein
LLAHLDAALEDPTSNPEPVLRELMAHSEGRDVARIVGEVPLYRAAARLVGDLWRY